MRNFGRKSLINWGVAAAFLAVCSGASAVTFSFNYLDPEGVGFNDTSEGALRREALQSVGDQIGSMLGGFPVTVRIDVNASEADGTGPLASSGVRYPGATSLPTGIWGGRLHQYVTTGSDGNGAGSAEAVMIWDLGWDWYFGADEEAIGSKEFDFRSVALHELTHAMGLASPIGEDGSGFRGNTPGTPDVYTRYDSFLQTSEGIPLIDASAAFNLSTLASITANDIFFAGTNAMAANGGLPVTVYAPLVWKEGSSISHLADPSDPMYYGIVRGEIQRSWTDVDVGILLDLGYAVIPEPATWMLLGMGMIGLLSARARWARRLAVRESVVAKTLDAC